MLWKDGGLAAPRSRHLPVPHPHAHDVNNHGAGSEMWLCLRRQVFVLNVLDDGGLGERPGQRKARIVESSSWVCLFLIVAFSVPRAGERGI